MNNKLEKKIMINQADRTNIDDKWNKDKTIKTNTHIQERLQPIGASAEHKYDESRPPSKHFNR